jgi:hypothetical protein
VKNTTGAGVDALEQSPGWLADDIVGDEFFLPGRP